MSMKLFLTTSLANSSCIGKWVLLPVRETRLPFLFDRMGIQTQLVDYFLTDREASTVFLRGSVSNYQEVLCLNKLAKAICNLTETQENEFCALMEYECCPDIKTAQDIITNQLPKWELVEGVDSDESFRAYLSEQYGREVSISEVSRLRKLKIFIITTFGCLVSTRLVKKSVWTNWRELM